MTWIKNHPWQAAVLVLFILSLGGLTWVRVSSADRANASARGARAAAPVEAAAVERGSLKLRRFFSGTLRTPAEYRAAPKVAGRIQSLTVDIGDPVNPGQLIAQMEDDEFQQALVQARAELAVEEARLKEAQSAHEIAERAFQRSEQLRQRGVASEAEYDSAQTQLLAAAARLQVAEAQVNRARAMLRTAEIRLGYTRIRAEWADGEGIRYVGERFVEEGQSVNANTELMRIVELNPLQAVIFVTERDYGRLEVGQEAEVTTSAFGDEVFRGHIARISPVFREDSRQARVELRLENPDLKLKPGMFVRAGIVLDAVDNALLIPNIALTSRNDVEGVYAVDEAEMVVRWVPLRTGIEEAGKVEVLSGDLSGRVVTLGQQLLDDGVPIVIPSDTAAESPRTARRASGAIPGGRPGGGGR